jgi:hypothetical protein
MKRRLILPGLLLLAGCSMPQFGTFTREVDVVGGDSVQVDFNRMGAVMAENDDVKINFATIAPSGQTFIQFFSFTEKRGKLPRSVKVEDVTAEGPETFVDDQNPRFTVNAKTKASIWKWESPSLKEIGWMPQWLHDPDETLRLYRFTIVTSDGRKLVMDQVTSYPAFVKTRILKNLGSDGPKKDDSVEEIHI